MTTLGDDSISTRRKSNVSLPSSRDSSPRFTRRFEDVPDIEATRGDYEILSWALEPGDAIAFHMKTVHGAPGTATLATRRRAIATRWLGDDAVFAERPFATSPPFPGLELEPGDPMEHELFPVVVSKS